MIEEKLNKLREKMRSFGGVAVAFSGGVDSAVLLAVANEELSGKMVAVIGESLSMPSRDHDSAISFCKKRKIPYEIIKTHELDNEVYATNPENRCFYCKAELFNKVSEVANRRGLKYVLEGTNASELTGHRPGFQAARENSHVATPYVELGITKDEIREFARILDLEVADKPSTACLASRLPTGVRIDAEILGKIDAAENFLLGLGVKQVRLRYHGDLARIEVEPGDFELCISKRDEIIGGIKKLGWKYVTLDMMGYRTGGGR